MKQLLSITIICIILSPLMLFSQIDFNEIGLEYYLPESNYKNDVPTPKEFLGYQVGEWHVNHDRLVAYMSTLAKSSDRIILQEYGKTYEERPLINLFISSPKNLARLDEIKKLHQQNIDPTVETFTPDLPLIFYQGYSIHGDESSGANGAMLVAYHLAASTDPEIEKMLDDLIIIFDPCYNPDGFQRYAAWVNAHQDHMHTPDPNDLSHNEPWPTGRTNHYWFDLNRDWLLLTHKESRARIKVIQEWRPGVLTDHHEMGKNSTFFFQPGVPSRTNHLTPEINQQHTEAISKYHERALDSIGAEYFSKKRFDDFYYGKGSTYPDGQGCIGILFEQATSEGIRQETENGILTFPFCVRNQVVTSFSSLNAAVDMKEDIQSYSRDFYRDRYADADDYNTAAFIVKMDDPWRRDRFADILAQHSITVKKLKFEQTYGDVQYSPEESFVVPLKQMQHTLVRSIFETVNEFQDSVFYDVSTWTFPFAFNAEYTAVPSEDFATEIMGDDYTSDFKEEFLLRSARTMMVDWNQYMAPALLNVLQQNEIPYSRLAEEFCAKDGTTFKAGSLVLERTALDSKQQKTITDFANEHQIRFSQMAEAPSVLAEDGLTLTKGKKKKTKIALMTGDGLNSYDVGHAWFQLDYRWKIPVTRLEIRDLYRTDISDYTTIVLSDGNYNLDGNSLKKINDWVNNGGNLVCIKKSVSVAMGQKWFDFELQKLNAVETDEEKGAQVIGGCILSIDIDPAHGLCRGITDTSIPVFRKGNDWYLAENTEQQTIVARHSAEPLISGFASDENVEKAKNSVAIAEAKVGEGSVIYLAENPNFRGYWYGGAMLFANCVMR